VDELIREVLIEDFIGRLDGVSWEEARIVGDPLKTKPYLIYGASPM
jgi:hypothetical protein